MGPWTKDRRESGEHTRVSLLFGLPDLKDPGIGGDNPDVQVFDESGDPISETTEWDKGAKHAAAGDSKHYYLKPKRGKAGTRPAYLRIFHGGKDPICLAGIGVQNAQDALEEHVFGDFAMSCGWKYYDSQREFMFGENGVEVRHRPRCFWMGGEGEEFPDHVWLHLPDFTGEKNAQAYTEKIGKLCDVQPRLNRMFYAKEKFKALVFEPKLTDEEDEHSTVGTAGATRQDEVWLMDKKRWAFRQDEKFEEFSDGNQKREQKLRRERERVPAPAPEFTAWPWQNQYSLSTSEKLEDGAIYKCEKTSRNFVGPDWANSVERMYCDLRSRALLPFCEEGDGEEVECFDAEAEVLRRRVVYAAVPTPHVQLNGVVGEGDGAGVGDMPEEEEAEAQHWSLQKKKIRFDF